MDTTELALAKELSDSFTVTDNFLFQLLLKEANDSVMFDVAVKNDEIIFDLDPTSKEIIIKAIELSLKRYVESKAKPERLIISGEDEILETVKNLKPGSVFVETDSSMTTFKFIKLFDGQVILENSNGLPMDYGTPGELAFIEVLHQPKD